jgi:hypothetical protein
LMSKMSKRYFKIIANQGVLIKFQNHEQSLKFVDAATDYYNLAKKE